MSAVTDALRPPQQTGADVDPIVKEAQRRFDTCVKWEATSRKLFLDDLKFAEADADNAFQWPNAIRRNRDADERPCLTVNKTRVHNLQIINDMKQNPPQIVARPTGNGATFEAAQCLTDILRYVQYISNANTAYSTAAAFQVRAGIGWVRVTRDYAGDDTFDQEIFIRRVTDPLAIYCDPEAKEADKSDSRFLFVFDDVNKEEFDEAYPEWAGWAGQNALGNVEGHWVTKDHVRICEYFRRVEEKDTLCAIRGPDGSYKTIKKSALPKEIWQEVDDDPMVLKRVIYETKIKRYLIIGEKIAEETDEPGRYIPFSPAIGEETVIDGVLDRKGHTRALKDPQRIYNYWTSSAVEHVALQSKTPYIAAAAAIEEYESYWNTANKVNHSVLPYNAYDDLGNVLQPPQRQEPPQMAQGYTMGMQVAANELMMVSGQYQPMMGEPSNERSGKALAERQRQGDNATYHYIDNMAICLRHVAKIVLDLIPHVYDTKRVVQIMAIDGKSYDVEIDPNAAKAYQQELNHAGEVAKRIFNPKVGKYEIQADIGPSYGTRREQAFDAYITLLTQAPAFAPSIADLLLQNADFPSADEAARRLRRMVPKQALGEGPSQEELTMQQQLANSQGMLQKALDELAAARLQLKGKAEMRDIDAYDAETKRLQAVSKAGIDMGQLRVVVAELMHDIARTPLDMVLANAKTVASDGTPGPAEDNGSAPPAEQPPMAGARKAPDGEWYVSDPARPGKYAKVLR